MIGITTLSTGRPGIYHGGHIMEGEQLKTDPAAARYDKINVKNETDRTHFCDRTIGRYNGQVKLQQETTVFDLTCYGKDSMNIGLKNKPMRYIFDSIIFLLFKQSFPFFGLLLALLGTYYFLKKTLPSRHAALLHNLVRPE